MSHHPGNPYPRVPYDQQCPWPDLTTWAKQHPIQSNMMCKLVHGVQAIYAILGCDPSAGRDTVEDVIKELLLGGGTNTQVISVQHEEHRTRNNGFRVVEYLTLDFDSLPSPMTLRWDQAAAPAAGAHVQVYNITDTAVIATSAAITAAGIQSLALPVGSIPTGVKLIAVRHRVVTSGQQSEIRGATLYTGV